MICHFCCVNIQTQKKLDPFNIDNKLIDENLEDKAVTSIINKNWYDILMYLRYLSLLFTRQDLTGLFYSGGV